MIKILYFFLFYILISFLFGCSLDTKSGIWENKKKVAEIKNVKKIFKKISFTKDSFKKEFNTKLSIVLNEKPKLNNNWKMEGLNFLNSTEHLIFNGKIQNQTKLKFKKIKNRRTLKNNLIIEKDSIFAIDSKGSIIKFSKNGKIIWKKNIYNRKEKRKIKNFSLAVSNNNIYAFDNLGKYYALSLKDGRIVWSKKHHNPFNSQVKILNNKIIIVDGDNKVICISQIDGKKIWEAETQKPFIKTKKKLSLVLYDDFVIFSNTLGDINKVDLNTGKIIWFMPTQNTLIPNTTNFLEISDLVYADNNIIFSNNFSEIYSIDSQTGILNWKKNIKSTLRPIVIDSMIFTISQDGFLMVLNMEGEILRSNYLLKKFKSREIKKLRIEGFLIGSNNIYITTNLGHILVCSVNNGKVESIKKVGHSRLSEPYIVNNKLYVSKGNSVIILD